MSLGIQIAILTAVVAAAVGCTSSIQKVSGYDNTRALQYAQICDYNSAFQLIYHQVPDSNAQNPMMTAGREYTSRSVSQFLVAGALYIDIGRNDLAEQLYPQIVNNSQGEYATVDEARKEVWAIVKDVQSRRQKKTGSKTCPDAPTDPQSAAQDSTDADAGSGSGS
jgi:hypothetical protein